jgi:hypothetical protein
MSRGGWWPGTVESISYQGRLPLLKIRFECQKFRDGKWDGPHEIGTTTARMRHLELRDPQVNAIDQPPFTPTPLMEKEERPDPSLLGATEISDENSLPDFIKGIFHRPRHNSSLARLLAKFEVPK